MQRNAHQFSHQNKGFINYVFCRNRAVRSPAGTRLDSSLVNKLVDHVVGSLCKLFTKQIVNKTNRVSEKGLKHSFYLTGNGVAITGNYFKCGHSKNQLVASMIFFYDCVRYMHAYKKNLRV